MRGERAAAFSMVFWKCFFTGDLTSCDFLAGVTFFPAFPLLPDDNFGPGVGFAVGVNVITAGVGSGNAATVSIVTDDDFAAFGFWPDLGLAPGFALVVEAGFETGDISMGAGSATGLATLATAGDFLEGFGLDKEAGFFADFDLPEGGVFDSWPVCVTGLGMGAAVNLDTSLAGVAFAVGVSFAADVIFALGVGFFTGDNVLPALAAGVLGLPFAMLNETEVGQFYTFAEMTPRNDSRNSNALASLVRVALFFS